MEHSFVFRRIDFGCCRHKDNDKYHSAHIRKEPHGKDRAAVHSHDYKSVAVSRARARATCHNRRADNGYRNGAERALARRRHGAREQHSEPRKRHSHSRYEDVQKGRLHLGGRSGGEELPLTAGQVRIPTDSCPGKDLGTELL